MYAQAVVALTAKRRDETRMNVNDTSNIPLRYVVEMHPTRHDDKIGPYLIQHFCHTVTETVHIPRKIHHLHDTGQDPKALHTRQRSCTLLARNDGGDVALAQSAGRYALAQVLHRTPTAGHENGQPLAFGCSGGTLRGGIALRCG